MTICLETSAIVAIILDEPEQPMLLSRLERVVSGHCPATCVLEGIIVLVRKQKMTTEQAKEVVFQLLDTFGIRISSFDEPALNSAIDGYAAFGKGRGLPKALLNFGDCLAYGVAKTTGGELLYTGDDFARTDLG